MIDGIDNIGIAASDLERSVVFYGRLGFLEAYRNDRGVLLEAGTARLFLFRAGRVAGVGRTFGLFDKPPGIDHLSLAVADVDRLYRELSAAGTIFAAPPEDQSWGARMVSLLDPDGNNLYLLQKL